ncbi:MAG: hypothetical protein CBC13_11505 [Planctomycetia bacterium TMED53]|nr:MAG: hypothetical protein CBC13_11505 [Planctomycetia bacterium TMED53]
MGPEKGPVVGALNELLIGDLGNFMKHLVFRIIGPIWLEARVERDPGTGSKLFPWLRCDFGPYSSI